MEGTKIPMKLVATTYPFVVGVDTHVRKHVYSIVTDAGVIVDSQDFPTTAAGISRALAWVARRTYADLDILWVIEGAASHGAILTGTVAAHGCMVAEAPRMHPKQHGIGKSTSSIPNVLLRRRCPYRWRNYGALGWVRGCVRPFRFSLRLVI